MGNFSWKPLITTLITIAVLTAALIGIIDFDYQQVMACLSGVSPWALILLLCVGIACRLIDAVRLRVVFRETKPGMSLTQAAQLTYIGVFAENAAFFAAIPLQGYFLHRRGQGFGRAVGKLSLSYVLYKSAVVFCATLALLLGGSRLTRQIDGLPVYLSVCYSISLVIITSVLLLCFWKRVRALLLWLLDKLPKNEAWTRRTKLWRVQVDALYLESRSFFHDRRTLLRIFLLDLLKLLLFYTIPYLCQRVIHLGEAPAPAQSMILAALMTLMAHSLPNISGMGPTEFGFMLLFSPYLGENSPAALLLFRLVTYYAQFLIGCVVFLWCSWRSAKGGAQTPSSFEKAAF